jgi:hypothetical protein
MIQYSHEKNALLKQSRGIGFEEIIAAMEEGNVLDVYDHPDQLNYPLQKIYVVEALDYIYLVPFVRNDDGIFLKTIIPSRKAKKLYKGDSHV